jgi:cell division protein FtsA
MRAARVEKLISAIDIGSSKVSALIAGVTDSGELLVLGTGQRESRGVTRGCIADVEQAELSVRHAVEQAERIAGLNIDRVWVGMSAGGLDSLLAPVEIELGGDRITQEDVDELLQAGRANIQTGGNIILAGWCWRCCEPSWAACRSPWRRCPCRSGGPVACSEHGYDGACGAS